MSVEQELKNLILEKYGSVAKFAETIEIAPTTIFGVFKRGVRKTNGQTILKICHALDISVDRIANGEIVPVSEDIEAIRVTRRQRDILEFLSRMNEDGEKRVLEYARMISKDYQFMSEEEKKLYDDRR